MVASKRREERGMNRSSQRPLRICSAKNKPTNHSRDDVIKFRNGLLDKATSEKTSITQRDFVCFCRTLDQVADSNGKGDRLNYANKSS